MQHHSVAIPVLILVLGAGCQTHPYGYGYPGNYPSPNGPYMQPPDAYPPPQGHLAPPPGSPALQPAQPWQQPVPYNPPPTGQLPQSSTQLPSGANANGQRLVPEYSDPASSPAQLGSPLDDDADSFGRPTGMTNPTGAQIRGLTDDSEENLAGLGNEGFADPIQRPLAASQVSHTTAGSRPNPYNYDRKGFTWIRGVVSFDDRDKTWHITYNPDPLSGDPYGGSFTLVYEEMLDSLLADDVVLVEGAVAPDQRDRFGKPSYWPRKVYRLVPKQ